MKSVQSYIISVSAGTGCYRHIRIAVAATLFDLHAAILKAFDFEDDHAHAFFMGRDLWDKKTGYYANLSKNNKRHTKNCTLESMALQPGKIFKYVYDFGDEWVFLCKVLRVLDEPTAAPAVIRRQGKAPDQYRGMTAGGMFGHLKEYEALEFPKIYSPTKLKLMYAKLGMPEETVKLLHTYFEAMTRLYGVIPLRKAFEIINQQNEPISEEAFTAFSEIVRHEKHFYRILGEDELYTDGETPAPLDRELVAECLYAVDMAEYDELVKAQHGKPYYIPPKQELLKCADPDYYEATPHRQALWDFLRHDLGLAKPRAEEFLCELLLHAEMGESNFQIIFDDMERMKLRFDSQSAAEKFIRMYAELSNHSRMPYNRGYTPVELSASRSPEERMPKSISFGPNMTAALQKGEMDIEEMRKQIFQGEMPNEQLRMSMLTELNRIQKSMAPAPSEENPKKIGRNDPCPCGSGKKYKKCCGRDQDGIK